MFSWKSIARTLGCATLLWLTACSFSFRSLNDLPTGLHVMGIQTTDTYAELTSAMTHMLKDTGVRIVQPEKARYSLVLEDTTFNTDLPVRFNNSVASTYTYTISVQAGIQDHTGHLVVPLHAFSASEAIVHNVNQTDTPVMIRVVRQELIRGLSQQIYAWLTDPSLKDSLTLPLPTPAPATHTPHPTTRHTQS